MEANPKPIGLTDLIYEVKRELLEPNRPDDPDPLFVVDEVRVEATVVVTREGEAGINLQVVSLGANVARQRTQTVCITLRPLCTRDDLLERLHREDPEAYEQVLVRSDKLMRGGRFVKSNPGSPK